MKTRTLKALAGAYALATVTFAAKADGGNTGWMVLSSSGHWNQVVFGSAAEPEPYGSESYYAWEYHEDRPWYGRQTVWFSWSVEYVKDGMYARNPSGFGFDATVEWSALHSENFDVSLNPRAASTTPYGGSKKVVSGGFLPDGKSTIRIGYTFSREEMPPGDDYSVTMRLATKEPLISGELNRQLEKRIPAGFFSPQPVRFIVPELDLEAKEADPASGTLTICWEISEESKKLYADRDWDLRTGDMRLKIWRSSSSHADAWDDFFKAEPVEGGEDVAYSQRSFTDRTFGQAKGGRPVMYWVEIKGGLQLDGRPATEPNRLKTRNRKCLSFGLSRYARDTTLWNNNNPPKGHVHDAEEAKLFYGRLMSEHLGRNVDPRAKVNSSCTVADVENEIRLCAESSSLQPGDEVFVFIATHGNPTDIALYDGVWNKQRVVESIRQFKGRGVKVVGVLNACHSGAVADMFDTEEFRYTAWVAAARNGEVAACYDNMSGFGKVLMDWGWNEGYAKQPKVYSRDNKLEATGATSSEYVNLLEVAKYANLLFPGRSTRVTPASTFMESHEQHFHCVNEKLLGWTDLKFIGAAPSPARPSPPRIEGNTTPKENVRGIVVHGAASSIYKYEYRKMLHVLGDMTWGVGAIQDEFGVANLYTEFQYGVIKQHAGNGKEKAEHYFFHFAEPDASYDVYARILGPAGWSDRGDFVRVKTRSNLAWLNEMGVSGKLTALAQTTMDGFGSTPQQVAMEASPNGSTDTFTLTVRIGENLDGDKYGGWYRKTIENASLDSSSGSITLNLDDAVAFVREDEYGLTFCDAKEQLETIQGFLELFGSHESPEAYAAREGWKKKAGGKFSVTFSSSGLSCSWAGKTFSGDIRLQNMCDDDDCEDEEEEEEEYVPFITEQTDGAVAEVDFDGNGGFSDVYWRTVVIGQPVGRLPSAWIGDRNFVFDGWWTSPSGGTEVTAATIVTAPATYYAHWRPRYGGDTGEGGTGGDEGGGTEVTVPTDEEEALELFDDDAPETPFVGNATYIGWVRNKDGSLAGLLTVKAGKPAKPEKGGRSKLTVSYTPLGGKRQNIKLSADAMPVAGDVAFVAIPGIGTVKLTGDALAGVDVDVQAARNRLVSRDREEKSAAAAALAAKAGAWTFALGTDAGYAAFSVTVDKKGKGKLSGTLPDGTKVGASSQGTLGDGVLAIPFAYAKKGSVGLVFWVKRDGTVALGDLTKVSLANGAAYSPAVVAPGATGRLPDGEHVFEAGDVSQVFGVAGKKWNVPRQNKRADPDPNPTALKLSFTEKTGVVKGSFTVTNGRAKTKYTVAGAVVGSRLYGSAFARNTPSLPATAR